MGNIKEIEEVYKITKEFIVYDSFQTVMVAIVLFISISKLWEQWQSNLKDNNNKLDISSYWGQVQVYILICLLASNAGIIFNMVESLLVELHDLLIESMGGDSSSAAWDSIASVWKKQDDLVTEKELEGMTIGIDDVFILRWLINGLAVVIGGIGIFIFKYMYEFFLMGRYMWLLLLEMVAPVAIILMLSKDTQSYFFTWLKNMFLCYLLVPAFLLADKFSNELGLAFVKGCESAGEITILLSVCAAVIVKFKMFAIVKNKINQLI